MFRLEKYVFPILGDKHINRIEPRDVLALVRPIDQQGHNETARRLLQIIAQVYRYALIVGRAERNPANDLSGALRPRRVTHRAAVTEPKKVGQLLRNIDNYDGYFPIICSLRLAPLVFVRPTELRAAVWSEFNLEEREWRIPAARTKMKQMHIVPLSTQAMQILEELHPYSADEFRNLFLCEFVDDTQSVFRLADLETCYADTDAWPDFNPTADRPLGNLPVWGGYDPSRSRDDASFVIVAPPLKEGGEHRVVARYKWLDKSYIWQAERIRELVGRYNFRHIGVDVTGPGIGVFEQIRAFFPLATPINYSVQLKTQLVLKAKELIEAHRLKWDAGQNDIAHAFLTIRQGVTDSGQISYSASRTSATGHADVAWAIMHALAAEPIGKPKGGCVVFIQ
ncbi:hypothetical protein [Bilophila wadsworthia]|uniref:phage terminase large subunit family protein n=2 Tax=Bilophila TaxID=35832 RepID=UPI002592500E|nr:hypothetical protein [Bilophila wadsworthia]